MNGKLKKIIAASVAAVMLICSLPLTGLTEIPGILDMNAFAADSGTSGIFSYQISYGEATITDCNVPSNGEVVIPDEINGYPVTSVQSLAFFGKKNLKTVVIPDSVKLIGFSAFEECTGLVNVAFGNGVEILEADAFAGCSSLERVVIPDSVYYIDNCVFQNSGLKDVTLPDTLEVVGACAFDTEYFMNPDNWNGEKVLYIGNNLIISDGTSQGVYKVREGTKTISSDAFYGDSGITEVIIPDSVVFIGEEAFGYCDKLVKVTLPEGLEQIWNATFRNCIALESVNIPASVKAISPYAFAYCKSLESITLPDGLTKIPSYCFQNCQSLDNVVIPDSVKTIEASSFSGCSTLNSIQLPANLSLMGSRAFSGCPLSDVYFSGDEDALSVLASSYSDFVNKYIHAHKWQNPVWTWKDGAATAEFICTTGKHKKTVEAEISKKPSGEPCTGEGQIEYTASVYMIDEKKIYNDKKTEKVSDIGHDFYVDSWTWNGTESAVAHVKCKNNCSFERNIEATVTSKLYDSTCTADGVEFYTATVTVDGKTFTDSKGISIEATGHDYSVGSWEWYDDYSARAYIVCANDSAHNTYVDATVTNEISKSPCVSDGIRTYTAKVNIGGKEYTDNKYVTIPMEGHKYSKSEWTWVSNEIAYVTVTCDYDSSHTVTREATVIKTENPPTCEVNGSITYTATAEVEGKTYTDSKKEIIEATGHSYKAVEWGWDKISTARVWLECENDPDHKLSKEATLVITEDPIATCTSDGMKYYTGYAKVGDQEFSYVLSKVATKATGHAYGEWKVIKHATPDENGIMERTCLGCDSVEKKYFAYIPETETTKPTTQPTTEPTTEPTTKPEEPTTKPEESTTKPTEPTTVKPTEPSTKPAEPTTKPEEPTTGHVHQLITEIIQVGCTVSGHKKTYCAECGVIIENEVYEAKGHSWSEWTVTKEAGIEIAGIKSRSCSACGAKHEEVFYKEAIMFDIKTPSTDVISYGDSIVLHAEVNLPEGAKVIWKADNSNFEYETSADGMTCTITPVAKGDTVFTAYAVDKDGKEISFADTQSMTSKAGILQKIIAFFKKIFGLNKIIPYSVKELL